MLKLQDVTKDYVSGELIVHALKGVTLEFRKSEFVAILGQSGCGKTTLLNIMGGLDKYTSGDLIINGVSTKDYSSRDWDNYRNHSIGFIFQSYNLIMHQSVLENVELALTLSGVKKSERRERAKQALIRVGLEKEINKKPNQLSGGQMQRVAIARAIVNNPDIILADEPTGALDTETSISVMDILKDIAKDRLVIMVTHNPDLAVKYSDRIIKMADGKVFDDSNPVTQEELNAEIEKANEQDEQSKSEDNSVGLDEQKGNDLISQQKKAKKRKKKASMSWFTAFSLSLKNLFTKKARTILVSIAGSIGIIGIALIMSVSSGFQGYIDNIQRDTLSSSPVTVSQQSINYMDAFSSLMTGGEREGKKYPTGDYFSSNSQMENIVEKFVGSVKTVELKNFKNYLEQNIDNDKIHGIRYSYTSSMMFYGNGTKIKNMVPIDSPDYEETINNYRLLYPYDSTRIDPTKGLYSEVFETYVMPMFDYMNPFGKTLVKYDKETKKLVDNWKLVKQQYELLRGDWPNSNNKEEVILVVDEYNQIADNVLFALGMRSEGFMLYGILDNMISGGFIDKFITAYQSVIDDINKNGKILDKGSYATWKEYFTVNSDKKDFFIQKVINGMGIQYNLNEKNEKIPFEEILENTSYKIAPVFTEYEIVDGKVVKKENYQEFLKSNDENVLNIKVTGVIRLKKGLNAGCLTGSGGIVYSNSLSEWLTNQTNNCDIMTLLNSTLSLVDDAERQTALNSAFSIFASDKKDKNGQIIKDADGNPVKADVKATDVTNTLKTSDLDSPYNISIYASDFDNKDYVTDFIKEYNEKHPSEEIEYSDMMGSLFTSVSKIVNAITYVLIAFVSISLIVSSIMIGIITYISVLERTKEIGVLRSIGASKGNVASVFNAEALLIGFASGLLGIVIAMLLNLPINAILLKLTGVAIKVKLPAFSALILMLISMVLTTIAGFIPSRIASKKDPVVALRSEN